MILLRLLNISSRLPCILQLMQLCYGESGTRGENPLRRGNWLRTRAQSPIKLSKVWLSGQIWVRQSGHYVKNMLETPRKSVSWYISNVHSKPILTWCSTCLRAARSSWMRVFHSVKASSILNRSAMLTIWWVLSISASGSFAHREIEDKRLFIRAAIWPERLNLLGS